MMSPEDLTVDLRADHLLQPVIVEGRSGELIWGFGDVHVGPPGAAEEVTSVSFDLEDLDPATEHDPELWGDTPVEKRLSFDVPRVHRRWRATDVDVRLIAGLIAMLSTDCAIEVTLLAEPRGWQSLKLARREAEVPAIVDRWKRLGLHPYLSPYSCQPATVARVAHNYRVPTNLATWGTRFEQAVACSPAAPIRVSDWAQQAMSDGEWPPLTPLPSPSDGGSANPAHQFR